MERRGEERGERGEGITTCVSERLVRRVEARPLDWLPAIDAVCVPRSGGRRREIRARVGEGRREERWEER